MSMKRNSGSMLWLLIALSAGMVSGGLRAQVTDTGIVNHLSGEVTFAGDANPSTRATPFMKLRAGDRFTVSAGATIRLVYFKSSLQESWTGPASFRVGTTQSEAPTGKLQTSELPAVVALKIARVPDMMLGARVGGVTVRGSGARANLTADERAEISRARAAYASFRKQAAEDDATPELYLATVLQEYGQYAEMKPLIASMRKRQPASVELRDLEVAVEKWAAQ